MGSDKLPTWKTIITEDVKQDLDNFVYYLLVVKMNDQAASALLDDYDATINELSKVAGSLKYLDDPELAADGYRKIRLRKHSYYLLYRVENDTAVVDRMLHDLQDLDKAMK